MFGWYMLLGILLLLLIIVVTPLKIVLAYRRKSANDYLTIEVSAWFHLIRYKYEIPVLKLLAGKTGAEMSVNMERESRRKRTEKRKKISPADIKQKVQKYKQFQQRVIDLRKTIKKMMRHVRCEEIEWHTRLGFGEAASTDALTGLVWGIKSAIVTCFSHYITMRTVPRLSVQPVWNGEQIQTQFRCILRFRLGHALVAGIRILLKLRRRREQKWQTTPSRV
ncbi:DUF2953 domain-containing protein [Brevibacillus humidisoli]|uniref:DUF2953 domain-containing protein n=1 Tax=Brevibacillus humidisoli TaxID=2895522 RepID=UPI001E4C7870|nr:DUF2953 domain-containing protein [Brevibacillus humidisoli]UFJ41621.1 DUF2953 domain-containing protein [Brevibacillus humidisoli]